MLPTETVSQIKDDRQRILDLLDRQEVIEELKRYGISKVEVVARINSLTDEEVKEIAGKLDQLPEGGSLKGLELILELIVRGLIFLLSLFIGGETTSSRDENTSFEDETTSFGDDEGGYEAPPYQEGDYDYETE